VRLGPGSARVSRAGFGVSPKRSSLNNSSGRASEADPKVRYREDAIANMRDACATRPPLCYL